MYILHNIQYIIIHYYDILGTIITTFRIIFGGSPRRFLFVGGIQEGKQSVLANPQQA